MIIYSKESFTSLLEASKLYPQVTEETFVFSHHGDPEDGELDTPYYCVALPATQACIKVTESVITDDNGGWGSGGYTVGELAVQRVPADTNLGEIVEFTDLHASEGVYGYVSSKNKGVVVYVE